MDIIGKWRSVSGDFVDDTEEAVLEFSSGQVKVVVRDKGSEEYYERINTSYSYQQAEKKKEVYFNFPPAGAREFTVERKSEGELLLKTKDKEYIFSRIRE